MAITLADFTKIWASTSPLTPYSFSESNYKEGWNFIGGTPPSRQMWDSIQNQNDEKLKYIVDNFLPKAGGTMTGAIVLADGGNPLSTAGGTMTGAIVLADGGNPLSTAGGTMTGDLDFYDDLFLGTPPDDVDPSQKSTYKGLYENKNDPHKYGGVAFHQETDNPSYRTQLILDAGDGTNRNWLALYGDAEGGLKYNDGSFTDGTFITIRSVILNVPNNPSNNVGTVNAPSVSGYQFVCWVAFTSSGGVFPCYGNYVDGTTTQVWVPTSHLSMASGRSVECWALYIRKW